MSPKEPAGTPAIQRLDSLLDSINSVFPVVIRKVLSNSMVRAKAGSSSMQALVIDGLASGQLTASDISRIYNISKPNVTALVDRLAERGYVERKHDAQDRRRVKISVTAKGRRLIARRRRIIKDYVLRTLEKLQPQEIDEIYISLAAFRDTLARLEKIF